MSPAQMAVLRPSPAWVFVTHMCLHRRLTAGWSRRGRLRAGEGADRLESSAAPAGSSAGPPLNPRPLGGRSMAMDSTNVRIDKLWLGPGKGNQLRVVHLPTGIHV